jgi:hypothetical protein
LVIGLLVLGLDEGGLVTTDLPPKCE